MKGFYYTGLEGGPCAGCSLYTRAWMDDTLGSMLSVARYMASQCCPRCSRQQDAAAEEAPAVTPEAAHA